MQQTAHPTSTPIRPSAVDARPVDHLLRDTFSILSSKFVRITSRRSNDLNEEDPDDCTAAESMIEESRLAWRRQTKTPGDIRPSSFRISKNIVL